MGQRMPYVPMHKPRKAVSIEDMQRILAKHTGKTVEIRPMAPPPAKPKANDGVRWKRLSDVSILSTTGRVITQTQDSSSRDIYIVFDSQSTKERTAQVLARFRSAQDAKDFVRLLPR